MKESVETIKKAITEREQTHHGIYHDAAEALSQFTTLELFIYYCDKDGLNLESHIRDVMEEDIIKTEINKTKYST